MIGLRRFISSATSAVALSIVGSVAIALGITLQLTVGGPASTALSGIPWYLAAKQLAGAVIGLAVASAVARVGLRTVTQAGASLLVLGTGTLCLPWIPGLGHSANGAVRWLSLPTLNLTLQPSAFAPMLCTIGIAYLLRNADYIGPRRALLVFAAVSPAAALTFVQPDFGSTFLILVLAYGILTATGLPKRFALGLPVAAIGPLTLALVSQPYRTARVTEFLQPLGHCGGTYYQVCAALTAMARGGVYGVGLKDARGLQGLLPALHTDAIAPAVSEAWGLGGWMVVTLVPSIVALQGFALSRSVSRRDHAILAIGMGLSFGARIVINLGTWTALLPPKGVALPFMSYGPSQLVADIAWLSLLVQVAQERPPVDEATVPNGTSLVVPAFVAGAIATCILVGAKVIAFPTPFLAEHTKVWSEGVSTEVFGRRGKIIDRNGQVLSLDVPKYALVNDKRARRRAGHLPQDAAVNPAEATRLAGLLGKETTSVLPSLNADIPNYRRVVTGVRQWERDRYQDMVEVGYQWERMSRRQYPMGPAAGQLVGYVDESGHGVAGLEMLLDAVLAGRTRKHLSPIPPRWQSSSRWIEERSVVLRSVWTELSGTSVSTSLDAVLQLEAFRMLAGVCASRRECHACAMAIDASGDIVVAASFPPLDTNAFSPWCHADGSGKVNCVDPSHVDQCIDIQSETSPAEELARAVGGPNREDTLGFRYKSLTSGTSARVNIPLRSVRPTTSQVAVVVASDPSRLSWGMGINSESGTVLRGAIHRLQEVEQRHTNTRPHQDGPQ